MSDIGVVSAQVEGDWSRFSAGANKQLRTLGRGLNSNFVGPVADLGDRINRTVGRGLTTGIKVGLGAATALAGISLKGGLSRLLNIEDAEAKLRALGYAAEDVTSITNDALKAVEGTPFALDAAITASVNALAAGVPAGEELTRVLGLTGDAATFMGGDFERASAITNKVLASNKLSMREVQQLNQAGVPILQFLQKEYDLTAEELSKMVSRGEVDSEMYLNALETNIGGAALEMGNTTRGAFANMRTALHRLGAVVLTGLGFDSLKDLMLEATTRIKAFTARVKESLAPGGTLRGILDRMGEALGTIVEKAREMAEDIWPILVGELEKSVSWYKENKEQIDKIGTALFTATPFVLGFASAIGVLRWALTLLLTTNPIGWIFLGLMALGTALVYAWQNSEKFREIATGAVEWYTERATTNLDTAKGAFTSLAEAISDDTTWIGKTVDQLVGIYETGLEIITLGIQRFVDWGTILWERYGGAITKIWDGLWSGLGVTLSIGLDYIMSSITVTLDIIEGVFKTILAILEGDWEEAWNEIKGTGERIWGEIKGFWEDSWATFKDWLFGAGQGIPEGLWDGMMSLEGWLREKVAGWILSVIPQPILRALTAMHGDLARLTGWSMWTGGSATRALGGEGGVLGGVRMPKDPTGLSSGGRDGFEADLALATTARSQTVEMNFYGPVGGSMSEFAYEIERQRALEGRFAE